MAAFVVNFSISSGIENEGSLFLENLKMLPTAFAEGGTTHSISCSGIGACQAKCGVHQTTMSSTGKLSSFTCPG